MIAPLQWSEVREPCEECRYYHVTADTPMGRFLIAWKGWEAYDGCDIEETPWGEWGGVGNTLEEAKAIAEAGWRQRIEACMADAAPSVPDGWKLVPVKATDEMDRTADRLRRAGCTHFLTIWDAVLAAAPEADL